MKNKFYIKDPKKRAQIAIPLLIIAWVLTIALSATAGNLIGFTISAIILLLITIVVIRGLREKESN